MWTGIGLCVAGAAGLVVVGVLDVDAADRWGSVAGGAAALVGLALTLYAYRGPSSGVTRPTVQAGGERSIAAGGNIGFAATGDGAAAEPPAQMPASSSPLPGRSVAASGDRSVAAGGDIGSVSTGDQ
ncbi:hypothetical protein I2W78_17445 [Streptomyces spinoverrucosus]|nr:hypothetical protein [Streptomyces spinoverrucosus]